jgi:putative N6-adenine-specific DNA methylase
MGKAFRNLDRWQIYILTNDEEFERRYGRRADKIRRLYNGMLRCNYYQFFKPINK